MPNSPKYTLARIEAACRAAGIREIDIYRLGEALKKTPAQVGRPKTQSDAERKREEIRRLERIVWDKAIESDSLIDYVRAWWYIRKIRSGLLEMGSTSPKSRSTSEDTEAT